MISMKSIEYYFLMVIVGLCFVFTSCENEYEVPAAGTTLQNDCIKRSLGPNLVGAKIEFAYAMALPPSQGKLISAKVKASIAGADGTYLEHRSFYTDQGGDDKGVEIGSPSVTEGMMTEVTFTKDTCAATLRYYYVIPEEARGKNISFSFYATDSNGRSVSYDMGTYFISNMDIKLDMIIPTDSYLSISDMAVYTNENMPTKADKIDLVYLYRRISGIDFLHALVSPGVGSDYLPEIVLPEGVNRMTSLQRTFGAIDQQLARYQYGTFIDDLDFYQMNFSNASNFIVNIKKDAGTWVETADGIYRAFIYVNKVDNAKKTMTISVKRLRVK